MHHIYFGKVIHGLGKGKSFGFPTINIELINNNLQLEKGVFVSLVMVNNLTYKGMLYVGTRPTLDMQGITIEIHILYFNQDIYDQEISFQILHKIRDEIPFESVEKLIEHLQQDKKMVHKFFNGNVF
jgi:riboflavin kinase/FMN adenylyltransferase